MATDSSQTSASSRRQQSQRDLDDLMRAAKMPAALVALAGWVLPGLGYVLIGQVRRGLIAGIAILLLFVSGIFIGGIRVIDVPGFDDNGQKIAPGGRWVLTSNPVRTLLTKSWYAGQILVGPVTLVSSVGSVKAAEAGYPQGTAHLREIATLYCAVAGMLNLVVLIDAAHRTTAAKSELRKSRRRSRRGGV